MTDVNNTPAIKQTEENSLEMILKAIGEKHKEERHTEAKRHPDLYPLIAALGEFEQAEYVERLSKLMGLTKRLIRKQVAAVRVPVEQGPSEETLLRGHIYAGCIGDKVLDEVVRAVRTLGVTGEGQLIKILYLALTSRLLGRPVSIIVKGPSSVGKSWAIKLVLKLFPESAYWARTGLSPKALAYSAEDYRHRTLVLYEVHANSEGGDYLLRSLLSEGHIVYETVESTPNGLRPKTIIKPGPTNLIMTTTWTNVHPENETRLLSVTSDDTNEQTQRIFREAARDTAQDGLPEKLEDWRDYQVWLASQPAEVYIPYAEALAELVPPLDVRLRRDFNTVLSLIRAHALLHQLYRERDGQGRIVADLKDYAAVRDLVNDIISEGVTASVRPTIRETVKAVDALIEGRKIYVTLDEIKTELKLGREATRSRVRTCLKHEYLQDAGEGGQGQLKKIMMGNRPLPEDATLLPPVEQLGCDTPDKPSGNPVSPGKGQDLVEGPINDPGLSEDNGSGQVPVTDVEPEPETGHLDVLTEIPAGFAGDTPLINEGPFLDDEDELF